jgi:cell division protein FtsB
MSTPAVALRARVPRLAGAALERARLSVVPRRRTRRTSPVPFLLVVSMLAVGGVVGLLLFNTSMQQASFAATSLQQQADSLEAQQQSLEMQLQHLRDPQVIALRAQGMGMVLPSNPAVLELKTGKIVGDPAPATGLDRLQLRPPPPAKPSVLKPPVKVTVVRPHQGGTAHQHDSSGPSTRGAHEQRGPGGRQGTDHPAHH